jgi:iron complex transport system permease protein
MAVFIPNVMRNRSSTMLVLSGVMVSGFLSSILGVIKYMADTEDKLESITYWQFGSFAHTQYDTLKVVFPILLVSFAALMLFSWRINLFSLEDAEVQTLGVNVEKERLIIILFSTLLTASATAISGTVGWVGLVVPHFARMLVGDNSSKLLPAVALLSAGLMILVDTICRSISGLEIPIGIITGVVGAPIFSVLLVRQKKRNQA